MQETGILSELEGASLAIIAELGPCTAYSVKEAFRASSSSYWSGSAGAIYPLVKRMHQGGLLATEPSMSGKRHSTLYTLSRHGRAALDAWLEDADQAASLGFDPLRTRLVFAALYPPGALDGFLTRTLIAMRDTPTPSPRPDDPVISQIHAIWLETRLEAFEKVAQILRVA